MSTLDRKDYGLPGRLPDGTRTELLSLALGESTAIRNPASSLYRAWGLSRAPLMEPSSTERDIERAIIAAYLVEMKAAPFTIPAEVEVIQVTVERGVRVQRHFHSDSVQAESGGFMLCHRYGGGWNVDGYTDPQPDQWFADKKCTFLREL